MAIGIFEYFSVQERPHGKVEFDSIDFSYPIRPNVKVLNQVSILVHTGDQIGLVGLTGSGKSTLAQLLYRFYDPQLGRIVS